MQFRANGLPRLSLIGHWRWWQDSNAPFSNNSKLNPTNALFATVNQMFSGSSQLPTTAEHCFVELTGFRGADYHCSASVAPSVVLSVNDGFQSWLSFFKFTDDIFHDRWHSVAVLAAWLEYMNKRHHLQFLSSHYLKRGHSNVSRKATFAVPVVLVFTILARQELHCPVLH